MGCGSSTPIAASHPVASPINIPSASFTSTTSAIPNPTSNQTTTTTVIGNSSLENVLHDQVRDISVPNADKKSHQAFGCLPPTAILTNPKIHFSPSPPHTPHNLRYV